MKVLLLNPPGRKIYLRDYYCSKVSKAAYLYHPTDLLLLSGILARRHEARVIDAIAEGLSVAECLRRIRDCRPAAVIALCGAVSWEEDRAFFTRLKESLPDSRLVLSGDLVLEGAIEPLRQVAAVDALLLDFTTGAILDYLEGGEGESIPGVSYRTREVWIEGEPERPPRGAFSVPVPRHELFPERLYRFPFARRHPFATVLTDYGCRFRCRFCVMGKLGHRCRSVENVLEELDRLRERGIGEIYFNDQTFGVDRDRAERLLRAMIGGGYRFGWSCWSRVDVVDEDLLRLMKQAGCHTVMFGAESGDDAVLEAARKGFGAARVKEALGQCRAAGLQTVATFLIGLPGQDRDSCLRTIAFAKECGCDFASFNLPVPRMTTSLRQQALEQGWIDEGNLSFDQSGELPVMGNGILGAGEIWRLRGLAIRRFYLRPSYLIRRLLAVRSLRDLSALIRYGWATIR